MKIAVLGGTGNIGPGLARRWAAAGHELIIGSRTQEKAEQAAAAVQPEAGTSGPPVQGMDNAAAAAACELAVLTVPWNHQGSLLETLCDVLQGKILVDVTVPLNPPAVDTVCMPPEGSAALLAQQILGEGVRVVSAFQNVAAHHLQGEGAIDGDVLVSSDDEAAAEQVCALAGEAGMRAFYAGPLANAVVAEALTSVLIRINRRHKCHSGVRITGIGQG